MSCAVAYANEWRYSYYNAVGNDSILRNTVGLGIIPLSALALYRGVASTNHAHNIAALGIGAASLYLGGSYLQSSPRQKVYLAGSQAIGCALLAVRPLLMSVTDYQALLTDLQALSTSLATTDGAVRSAQAWIQQAKAAGAKDSDAAEATAELTAAQSLQADATQIWTNGTSLAASIKDAGYTLGVTVDNIRDTVSGKIIDTEPDLASIMSAVGGLGKLATTFEPTAPVAAATASTATTSPITIKGAAPGEALLKEATDGLRAAEADLAAKANAVRQRINVAAAAAKVDSALASCKVADVDDGFHVVPDAAQQTLPADQSLRFTVTSAAGIPRASRAGAVVTGVDLSSEFEQGSFVAIVHAAANTPGGTMQLVLADSTGKHQKTITIKITKAGAAPSTSRGTPQANSKIVQAVKDESNFSEDQREIIQKGLNVDGAGVRANGTALKVDGVLGTQTRAAIKEYQKEKGVPQTGGVTQVLFVELQKLAGTEQPADSGAAPAVVPAPASTSSTTSAGSAAAASATAKGANSVCPAGPSNDYEKSLSKNDILNIQQALGLPAARRTGALDETTRGLIKSFSKSVPSRPSDLCLLNADLEHAIIGP